jgi:hypothetical protein
MGNSENRTPRPVTLAQKLKDIFREELIHLMRILKTSKRFVHTRGEWRVIVVNPDPKTARLLFDDGTDRPVQSVPNPSAWR